LLKNATTGEARDFLITLLQGNPKIEWHRLSMRTKFRHQFDASAADDELRNLKQGDNESGADFEARALAIQVVGNYEQEGIEQAKKCAFMPIIKGLRPEYDKLITGKMQCDCDYEAVMKTIKFHDFKLRSERDLLVDKTRALSLNTDSTAAEKCSATSFTQAAKARKKFYANCYTCDGPPCC